MTQTILCIAGSLALLGMTDCFPPIEDLSPLGQPCSQIDIPSCSGANQTVEGVRPLCTCVTFDHDAPGPGEPGDPPPVRPLTGSGQVSVQLADGWSLAEISGDVPTLALTGRVGPGALPNTSQPLEVTDTEFSGATVDFAFEAAAPSFEAVAAFPQLAVTAEWETPPTVSLVSPAGITVSRTLANVVLLPATVEGECEERSFSGELSQGPITLKFAAHVDSPLCE